MNRPRAYRFGFAKYPAVRLALLLISGILLAALVISNTLLWAVFLGLTLFAWIVAEHFFRNRLSTWSSSIATLCYLSAVICFGAASHSLNDQQESMPLSAQLLAGYTWESIEIKGTVQNIKQTSTGKYQIDVAVRHTVLQDSLSWNEGYTIRAVYDPTEQPLLPEVTLGTSIHFEATLYPLEAKSNPHEFDYKQYLASQNIYSQAGIDSILTLTTVNNSWGWERWRNGALQLIDQNFNPENEPIAKALLIGYKNDLQRDEKIAFSRVGLSHIMAVSGLHVGFIIAPFWIIIPFFWTFRYGKQIGLLLLILLLLFYAGITGFSASVTRASITGGLLAYGKLFHKSRDSKNLTAVAAIIILLADPAQLFTIGFQLSFAAVYIILLVLPVLQQILPSRIQHRWYSTPIMVVIVSVVVQLGLYPLLSFYFGEFSLVGPLANALIVPWLGLMVPYAILLLFISIVFPAAGFILNAPCRLFLDFLQWFVTTAATWHWSWIQTPLTGIFIFLIWAAAISFIAGIFVPRLRWKMLILLLVIGCMQQLSWVYRNLKPATLTVTMLDVGQGDAAYIRTPNGKNLLIDAGRWAPTYNSARYVIIPHLKALGIQKLDAIFLSHPHADHIGGIIELINEIEIDTIYNAGFAYDSELYKNYISLAENRKIPVQSLSAGDKISIDPALQLYIYGPSSENHHADPNEHSLVMELIYGQTEFLFTGDAGTAQEERVLSNFGDMLNTDLLKVGHHGSRTSSSKALLKSATPKYATVSLALNNKFKHPHPEAIERLSNSGTELLFTSLEGALIFESDGERIKRIRWR